MRVLPVCLLTSAAVSGLLAGAVTAGPASAAPATSGKPASLRATTLRTAAKSVRTGTAFSVSGTVHNSGGRAAKAYLSFKLRSAGRPHVLIPLATIRTAGVAGGRSRAFKATLLLKTASVPARISNPFHVVVCVGRTATERTPSRCRKSTTTLTIVRRTATGGSTTGPTTTTPGTTTTTPTTTPPTDTTAPTTTDDVPAAYKNAPIPVTLTAADETGGSGVSGTYYTKGTAPADPTLMSATYDPAARPTLNDGEVIRYRSVDIAGNAEAVHTSRVALVDTVAPTTTDNVTAATSSAPVQVTLAATDTGGSNVAHTYYTVGATPTTPTVASAVYDAGARPMLADGQKIRYFSVDFAGNAEAVKTSVAAAVNTTTFTPGARTANDTLFRDIGNGGYDAQHYGLDLSYVIATKALGGTTTATLKATQNLSRFSMDLAPWLRVSKVTIDGADATFRQGVATPATPNGTDYDYKLDITPASGIPEGTTLDVAVTYAGTAQPVLDPDGSPDGWIPDTTYGAIANSEPIGAMGWFPDNNVPFDKASFTIKMAVPDVTPKWVVVGTGVAADETVANGKRTYTWEDPDPTATYLASVSIAKFDLVTGTSTVPAPATNPTTVPFYTAVDSSFTAAAKSSQLADLNRTPSILDYYAGYYGVPYKFNAMGGVDPRQSVGYSLETQGKPTYAVSSAADSTGAGLDTVAHENGHMYFGDDVTLTQWKDIWLNEGMTEFSKDLWSANQDNGVPLSAQFQLNYNDPTQDFWLIPPAAPSTGADIFDFNAMYQRGSTTMIAIHEILGDARFRTLMHDYLVAPGHAFGNATTEQFIALVKAEDPTNAARWDQFFQQWLYTSYPGIGPLGNRPTITPTTFAPGLGK